MKQPDNFEPLPMGDAMWPQFTHVRSGNNCRDYWSAARPQEFTRVEYLSHYARVETAHPL